MKIYPVLAHENALICMDNNELINNRLALNSTRLGKEAWGMKIVDFAMMDGMGLIIVIMAHLTDINAKVLSSVHMGNVG